MVGRKAAQTWSKHCDNRQCTWLSSRLSILPIHRLPACPKHLEPWSGGRIGFSVRIHQGRLINPSKSSGPTMLRPHHSRRNTQYWGKNQTHHSNNCAVLQETPRHERVATCKREKDRMNQLEVKHLENPTHLTTIFQHVPWPGSLHGNSIIAMVPRPKTKTPRAQPPPSWPRRRPAAPLLSAVWSASVEAATRGRGGGDLHHAPCPGADREK